MKIMYLSGWYPYPPINGSKIRIYNLLKFLSTKEEVHLVTFRDPTDVINPADLDFCASIQTVIWQEYKSSSLKALLGLISSLPRSMYATYLPEMAEVINQAVTHIKPDLLVASQWRTAPYVVGIPNIPAILEELEVGSFFASKNANRNFSANLRHKLMLNKLRRYLQMLLARFEVCTVVSEQEKALVKSMAPNYSSLVVLPNGVDIHYNSFATGTPTPDTLIYNGSLKFRANFEAVKYCLSEIYPQIRKQRAGARFIITGEYSELELSGLALNESVILTGFLPDIRPAIGTAWASVVPLLTGGGTRLKILEAMALGTPVISTSKGAEGLQVTPGKDILIADHPAEFAQKSLELLDDAGMRSSLAHHGRQLVEREYAWQSIGKAFIDLIELAADKSEALFPLR